MTMPLAVGLSGGLDSTVLLHLMYRMHRKLPQLFSLSAIHVHHGLQPAADDFAQQCQRLCEALKVPLRVVRVKIPKENIAQQGLEAAARRCRYQAFADHLPAGAVLALAHHRDDLLETALLQWIRGAGLEGLSAMTRLSVMDLGSRSITLWRPLLDQGRSSLHAYALSEGLQWVEDPSNSDLDLARNRIRHEVMPVLRDLRQGADSAMARSIAHLQTARDLLELVTDQTLNECALSDGRLSLGPLMEHDQALAARVIRGWLRSQGVPTPPARRLGELLRQIVSAKEPRAQMDLTDPATGVLWQVVRSGDFLQIRR
jgi:tRNA(Ile)-lysidine synthase